MYVYLDSVHLETCAHDILSIQDCVNDWLYPLWILHPLGSVYLGLCRYRTFSNRDPVHFALGPLGSLSTWALSIRGSGYMTFCPSRIVFTIDTINCGFCSRLALCSWESVQLGGCLLEFCLFWESGHMTFCPRRILSIIDSVNYGFCPRVVLSTWESVQLCVCLPGFCPLWSRATWHSLQVGLCPLLVHY